MSSLVTNVLHWFRWISLKRLAIAALTGLVTTYVGMFFAGLGAHGAEWFNFVAIVVMPAAILAMRLSGPFHSSWYMWTAVVAQCAFWYAILRIPDFIRLARRGGRFGSMGV